MFRTCRMKSFKALEDKLNRCGDILRAQQPDHLLVKLVHGECGIKFLDRQRLLPCRLLKFFHALRVNILDELLHATPFQQGDAGTESDELLHSCHVYAVEVGIAYLWRTADNDNLLRMQTVKDFYDALSQGRPPHNRVINDHEIVLVRTHYAISDIIDMGSEVVAQSASGDECAQLYVLPRYLLEADIVPCFMNPWSMP